ncbi:hypothetical protein D3C87_1332590 [compost metagenome]
MTSAGYGLIGSILDIEDSVPRLCYGEWIKGAPLDKLRITKSMLSSFGLHGVSPVFAAMPV